MNWFATLIAGRSPEALQSFLARYVRYQVHVSAYLMIVSNRFPGFAAEPYEIDVEIADREPQSRWITAFRVILVIPALALSGGLFSALGFVALFGWFVSLVLGRMPEGLRNLGAYGLRYAAQVNGYGFILTDRYPYSGPPALTGDSGDADEPSSSELGVGLAA